MKCRFCGADANDVFVDLGHAPPSNDFLAEENLSGPEVHYPLKVNVCRSCWLVQTAEFKKADAIFSDAYVYFSSYSPSWVAHARRYVEAAIPRFGLTRESFVVEIASNDGYLLQFFKAAGIPCLGVEPSLKTAAAAREKGIDSLPRFFGRALAAEMRAAGRIPDLIVGNNVLAHVPDLRDFVAGVKELLAPSGVATFEFPHLMRLVADNQFDTIYHEHFSYFSFSTVRQVFGLFGLRLFDVDELPTHGGSLRVYAAHADDAAKPDAPAVAALLAAEAAAGMLEMPYYQGFGRRAEEAKLGLLRFLIDGKRDGKTVIGYGAAAKGNTLLNYAGVKPDLLPAIVDASPHKQGLFAPGSHIPVIAPAEIAERKPDFILILPWNLKDEIAAQIEFCRAWGCRFAVPIPRLSVF